MNASYREGTICCVESKQPRGLESNRTRGTTYVARVVTTALLCRALVGSPAPARARRMGARALVARVLLLLAASRRAQAAFVSAPPEEGAAGSEAAAAAGPYYLLQPSSFATVLGEDLDWASQNIPLFESANSTLDLARPTPLS